MLEAVGEDMSADSGKRVPATVNYRRQFRSELVVRVMCRITT